MTVPTVHRSIFGRLYHGETEYRFVGSLKRFAILSRHNCETPVLTRSR